MNLREKMMNVSINMRQFYIMGIICFLVVAVASIYTGVVTWEFMDLGSKVSTVFRSIFNFGIVFFFNFLLKGIPPEPKKEIELDVDKIISESEL